jgi:K+:H+ antiporter
VNEHDILAFLVALGLLLGVGRVLGELGRRSMGTPLVVGGVLAGLLLGKTVLGRAAPDAHAWLFATAPANAMLGGYAMLGALLVLVVAGLEVDLSVVRRRGRDALPLVVLAIAFPLAAGIALGFLLPSSDLVSADRRAAFAALLGFALALSALPAIARRLEDLGLFKTDLGLLIMTAATVGDLVGWLAFSVLLGLRGTEGDFQRVAVTTTVALASGAVGLLVGRRVLDLLFARIDLDPADAPGRILWFVMVLALLGAAATQAIGLHAVLGGFFVGVVVGDSPKLRVRTRTIVRDVVTNLFSPVFFAYVALDVDFVASFDLRLVLLVLAVATLAKVAGCSLGARLCGLKWREAWAASFALNARGSMEILLALLALRAALIREPMFVALVTMTVVTSLLSGPLTKRLLYRASREEDVVLLLRSGAFVPRLEATLPMSAIDELVGSLGEALGPLTEKAHVSVVERELVASTGLGDEIAIPHAAVAGLDRPLLALGRAPHGIDFDAQDGRPARIVFLLLVPPKAYEEEVQILASIARAVFDGRARDELMAAAELEDVMRVLDASAKRVASTTKRGSASRAAVPAQNR